MRLAAQLPAQWKVDPLLEKQSDEGGMEVSKNGNKIAVVGGASRVGCAAMTVTAAAILTASTLLGQERN